MNVRFSAAAIGVLLVAFLRSAPAAEISPPTFKWRDAKAAYAKYQAAIDQLDEEYRRGRLAALQAYLATLEGSLKAVMAQGNLDEANRINQAVKECRKAVEEQTTVTLDPKRTPAAFAALDGKWEGRWFHSGQAILVRVDVKGGMKLSDTGINRQIGTIEVRSGRFLCLVKQQNYWEFIPRGGKLVVVAWHTGEDPMTEPPHIAGFLSHPE